MSESSWTNPSAILRDLRFTQGRDVARGQTLTLIEDIPNFNVAQADDEEELYSYFGVTPDSGADFSNGADVDSIAEMISMMRNSADECPKPIEMCRFDNQPVSNLMVKPPQPTTAIEQNRNMPNRGGRNVAIQSLLENAGSFPSLSSSSVSSICDTEPADGADVDVMFPPLPSPSSTKIDAGRRKGNKIGKEGNGIKQPEQPRSSSSLSLSSLNFAAAAKTEKKAGKQPENKPTSVRLSSKQYVPTARSQRIYEKMLLEDSIRDMVKECVWDEADRQMDLIDERNEKSAEMTVEAQQKLQLLGYAFPVKICLPQQRHLTSDDCIVCKILCTNPDEAKQIQSITLKDISVPIQSTGEVENDITVIIDKMDDLNLNTSLEEKEMIVNDSSSEHNSFIRDSSEECYDFSIIDSDDSSSDDNDFIINTRDADSKVNEFKADLCGEDNGNDFNTDDSASNAVHVILNICDARSDVTNSKTSDFEVITKNQNDLTDITYADDLIYFDNKTSALDSDDYEKTNEITTDQKLTNKTGAIEQYDVNQSIPYEIEVTNEVKQSTTNEVANVVKESTKNEVATEVKQSTTNEVANKIKQSTTNEVANEVKESTTIEVANEVKESTTIEVANEVKESTTNEVTNQVKESTTNEVANVIKQSTTNEVANVIKQSTTNEVANVIKQSTTNEVANVIKQSTTNEITNEVKQSTTNEVANDVKESTTNEVANDVKESTTNEVANVVKESTTNEVANVVKETTTNEVANDVKESTTNKVANVVKESTTNEVANVIKQSTTNEITNEVKQSTTNEVANDVKESTTNEVANVVKQSVPNKTDVKSEVKKEVQVNNTKLPKHTYLRLLQYLQKSVSEGAGTRLSEDHS